MWVALAYGLGTLAFPYSTALFGHQLGAVCAFGAFMLLWRQRRGWTARRVVAAGLLVGLGAISDFTTLLVACFLGLYAVWAAARLGPAEGAGAGRTLGRAALFALCAAAPISLQLAANWRYFGSPLTFPHIYHVQPSFQARHTAGLLGVHLPQLYPLYQLTVGPWRGLFYTSPVLLLALPGLFLMGRGRRVEAALIAAAWLGVLLLNAGYENWTAGSSYGPRYQIPAIPFLMLAAAATAQRWPFVFKMLAAVSIAFTFVVTAQSPFVPEELRNPLGVAVYQFWAGEMLHGNLGKTMGLPGMSSLVPLAAVEAGFFYALSALVERD